MTHEIYMDVVDTIARRSTCLRKDVGLGGVSV